MAEIQISARKVDQQTPFYDPSRCIAKKTKGKPNPSAGDMRLIADHTS